MHRLSVAHSLGQADDRRIAEAHYKLSLTLHFLDNAEDALKHARAAVAVCNARIANLAPAAAAAAPADANAAAADAPAAEDAALAVSHRYTTALTQHLAWAQLCMPRSAAA